MMGVRVPTWDRESESMERTQLITVYLHEILVIQLIV